MGARLLALVVLASASHVACLDTPPAALGGGTSDDAAPDGCTTIVRNGFDQPDAWDLYEEPATSVEPAADRVHIVAGPSDVEVYAQISSVDAAPIDGTELTASLVVPEGSDGVAGISWWGEEVDDYYDLAVDDGTLAAWEKPDGVLEETDLCGASCPDYDPIAHARMRLQASGGRVHFQVAPVEGDWSDIASAQMRDVSYQAIAYGWADIGDVGEMTVTAMEWADCE